MSRPLVARIDPDSCPAWRGFICSDCAVRCEYGAIRFAGLWMPHVVEEICDGCGACVPGCRMDALTTEEKRP